MLTVTSEGISFLFAFKVPLLPVFQSVNSLCLIFMLSSLWEEAGESLITSKSITHRFLCLVISLFLGVTCFIYPDVPCLLFGVGEKCSGGTAEVLSSDAVSISRSLWDALRFLRTCMIMYEESPLMKKAHSTLGPQEKALCSKGKGIWLGSRLGPWTVQQ